MYRVTKYDASLLREKRGSHFFNRQYFNERKLLYILQLQLLTLFQLTVRRTQFTKLLHRLLYRNEETTKKKGRNREILMTLTDLCYYMDIVCKIL